MMMAVKDTGGTQVKYQLIRLVILSVMISLGGTQAIWAASKLPDGDSQEAKAAFYQGDYAKSIKEYQGVLKRERFPQSLVEDQAIVLLTAGHYQEAVELLKKNQINKLLLGEAYLALGEKENATQALSEGLLQPGEHYRNRLLLSWIAAKSNQHQRAIKLLWDVIRERPSLGYAHLLMGRCFHELAKKSVTEKDYFIKRAGQEYLLAKKRDASLWQAHLGLAYLNEDLNLWEKARQQWGRVRSVLGSSAEVKAAFSRLHQVMPGPTITPTPGVVIRAAKIEPAVINEYKIKPLGQKDDPVIKVGLARSARSLSFGCVGAWRALDHKGRYFWKGTGKRGYRIQPSIRGGWYLTTWDGTHLKKFEKSIMIKSLNPENPLVVLDHNQNDGYFWSGSIKSSHYYRGQIQVKLKKNRLRIINHVLLEDYLLSVVPGEMPALWPKEALKAQTVVARTDTLLRRGTHRKYGYDVCTTAHCAVYRGITVEHPDSHEAVADTQGEVLTNNDKLIPTFYSHACGGLTQTYQEAWWKKEPDFYESDGVIDVNADVAKTITTPLAPYQLVKWLNEYPEVFCSDTAYSGEHSFRWLKIVEREELSQLLDRKYKLGEVQAIQIKERGPSGYVRHIEIVGSLKTKQVYRDYIRSSLGGLRSNLFHISPLKISEEQTYPDAWIITGGGWGHGVGLCQAGAGAMGKRGYTYQEILRHYFPKSKLQVWTK